VPAYLDLSADLREQARRLPPLLANVIHWIWSDAVSKFAKRDREPPKPQPPRAGLRYDERDPDEPAGPPGSAGGDRHGVGPAMGGLSVGGLGGSNSGDGATNADEADRASGSGVNDNVGKEQSKPPFSGRSGGAVGGTPAEKRAKGGHTGGGIAPGTAERDSTIGGNPDRPTD